MADQRSIRDGINRHAGSELLRRLATHLYESRLWEKIDTWDMPWIQWILATGGFCLNPPRNLTVNHGMLPDATHTSAVDDVRGAYPLREWNPTNEIPSAVSLEEEYDRLVALLDIVLNYEHPRRWKVLAQQREHRPSKAEGAGWDVMLIPFDYPADTSKLISRLKRWITSPQLDRLAEIFPDQ